MTTFKYYQQVIPDGFYNLVFEHEINGDPDRTLCTWGVSDNGFALTSTDMNALAAAWGANVVDPLFSTNTVLVRSVLSDAGGVLLESDLTIEGSKVDTFGPVSNAVLVEKRSASSGRRNRGRLYLPALPDQDVDENGRVDLDLRDDCISAVQNFHDAVVGVGNIENLVILHSKGWGEINTDDPRDPVPADPGNAPAPTVITHYTSRSILGTQRRRVR